MSERTIKTIDDYNRKLHPGDPRNYLEGVDLVRYRLAQLRGTARRLHDVEDRLAAAERRMALLRVLRGK
jgi:hypothetical protein